MDVVENGDGPVRLQPDPERLGTEAALGTEACCRDSWRRAEAGWICIFQILDEGEEEVGGGTLIRGGRMQVDRDS